MSGAVYLVQGSDPTLRDEARRELEQELVGDGDRSLIVEDFTVPGAATGADAGGEPAPELDADDGIDPKLTVVHAACDAASSPPFLSELRVVVLHDIGGLRRKDQYGPVLAYLENPMPTTAFVLVAGGGAAPKALLDAAKKAGSVRGPESETTADVIATHARDAGLHLTPDARRAIAEHLGEDAGRVPAILAVLDSAFGPEVPISAPDVEPYLGAAGSVPVYELANRIDRGDVAGALESLRRMLETPSKRDGKAMHPLQVLALLHNHYRRMLRLDDPTIRGEADAHAALGGKGSPYGAKKAWQQADRLGHDGITRAFDLLARADLDCKGASGAPPETIVELLVARLAGLSRAAGRSRARR